MDLIRVRRNGGNVTVTFQIEGVVSWGYVYVVDASNSFRNSGANSHPHSHPLGLGAGLDHQVHTWTVRIANISDVSQPYTILVTWAQDGQNVKTWTDGPVAGEVDSAAVRLNEGNGLIVAI
jgi:hypothetical protein